MTGPSDWRPSTRPQPDKQLTQCHECGLFVEHLILHIMSIHPTEKEMKRLATKREKQRIRDQVRLYRRTHKQPPGNIEILPEDDDK